MSLGAAVCCGLCASLCLCVRPTGLENLCLGRKMEKGRVTLGAVCVCSRLSVCPTGLGISGWGEREEREGRCPWVLLCLAVCALRGWRIPVLSIENRVCVCERVCFSVS